MSRCPDKKFADLLAAYELGIIGDEERQEMELHILDCEACRSELAEFREISKAMRDDADVRSMIAEIDTEQSRDNIRPQKTTVSNRLKQMAPAWLAAAAVIVILLVQPWQLEFKPADDVRAAEDRLAVIYFDNLAQPNDPDMLGKIASNLLITDLSKSRFLEVVSGQRLFDAFRLLGKETSGSIDHTSATEVADEVGARWLLTGAILQIEPHYVVTSSLVDSRTGAVVASQRVTGDSEADIFAIIDSLTVEVKNALALPAEAQQEPDPSIADVTTHSWRAYGYYLEGCELTSKFFTTEAKQKFRSAIELDSTFAMAYLRLAVLTPYGNDRSTFLTRADRYSEDISNREKLWIAAWLANDKPDREQYRDLLMTIATDYPDEKEAHFRLGAYWLRIHKYNEALESLNQAIRIDPLYKDAYNSLAYTYSGMQDFDQALWAIDKYIELAPNEPNPWDTRGDMFLSKCEIDSAIQSFMKSIEIRPDFANYLTNRKIIGPLYHIGRVDEAMRWTEPLRSSSKYSVHLLGIYYQTSLLVAQGRFEKALAILDEVMDEPGIPPYLNRGKAMVLYEMGDTEAALVEMRTSTTRCLDRSDARTDCYRDFLAYFLAEVGQLDEAQEVSNQLLADARAIDKCEVGYFFAQSAIEMAKGNFEEAERLILSRDSLAPEYINEYLKGRIRLEAGNYDEAVATLEAAISNYSAWHLSVPTWHVKSHYWLARSYEGAENNVAAAKWYQHFLKLWGDADTDPAIVQDARQRLSRLTS